MTGIPTDTICADTYRKNRSIELAMTSCCSLAEKLIRRASVYFCRLFVIFAVSMVSWSSSSANTQVPELTIEAKEFYSDETDPNVPSFLKGYFIIKANPAPSADLPFRFRRNNSAQINSGTGIKVGSGKEEDQLVVFSPSLDQPLTVTLADSTSGTYTIGTPNEATVLFKSAEKPGIFISIVDDISGMPLETINKVVVQSCSAVCWHRFADAPQ